MSGLANVTDTKYVPGVPETDTSITSARSGEFGMGVGRLVATVMGGPEMVTGGVEPWPQEVSANAIIAATSTAIFGLVPGFDIADDTPVDFSIGRF